MMRKITIVRYLLEKSTRSTDIDERLQTLSLLAESHSSVEAFSQLELDLIQVRSFFESLILKTHLFILNVNSKVIGFT